MNEFRRAVAGVIHGNAQVSRVEVFGPGEPKARPINLLDDARVMFAGYVGSDYEPRGCVFVAINPGGGGDAYTARTPADKFFVPLLKRLKGDSDKGVGDAFEAVNQAFVPVVRQWPLWRILAPTLQATGCAIEEVAYLNAVPYRTRGDKMPSVFAQQTAWNRLTGPLISTLEPRTIVALGKKAGGIVDRFYRGPARTFCIPRTIGDTYLSDEAKAVLRQLRRTSGT